MGLDFSAGFAWFHISNQNYGFIMLTCRELYFSLEKQLQHFSALNHKPSQGNAQE